MPRAVVATAFGGPEVLSVVDEPGGEPGPGEVLLEVRAAGVNPVDGKLVRGELGRDPARLPLRPGFEAAGVVRAVGDGADGPAGPVSPGDDVIAFRISGGYASHLVVPAAAVVPKPAGLGWGQAAGLMLTGATAVHALHATRVGAGDALLLHAAAGGVGLMVAQIARVRGARVIGTARPERHDLLRGYGVEPVAYGDGLAGRVRALAPDGLDAAIDAVGTDEAVDVSLELVADRGRIATIAAFGRAQRDGIAALGGGPGADPGTELRDAARLELVDLVRQGRLEVLVAGTFPLTEAGAALAAQRSAHEPGKIVLVP